MDKGKTAAEAAWDIPRCPLTTRECDEHSQGLAAAQGIVELARHFIETRHFIDCTSKFPGLDEAVQRMGLEVGEIDTKSISAALYSAWSAIRAAKGAIDEAGCRDACGFAGNDEYGGRATS